MDSNKQSSATKPSIGAVFQTGMNATFISSISNALIYSAAKLFTFPEGALTPMGVPITVAPVIFNTMLGGIGAMVGFFVLSQFLPRPTANRVMWGIAVVVIVGMSTIPFQIENAPISQIIFLEIMHLVAALIPVYWLTSH
jgi:hypothetical protein